MKSLVAIIIVSFCSVCLSNAQVGFNNPNPDQSSILDLTAVDKGLLIPRLTTPQREAMASPGRSLMVFDLTEGKFYFHDGGTWYALNEWVRAASSNEVSLTGNVSVTGSINSTGTVTAANYTLNANGNGPVPAGGIIMWSGAIASIPTGWVLCDGTNFTPDLRDRFIVGAGSTYAVNNTGGANTVTLSVSQIPAHNHTMSTNGSHQHAWAYNTERDDDNTGSSYREFTRVPRTDASDPNYTQYPMDAAGNHTHTINNTGGGLAHENRPPYYALAYIMKLP